MTDAITPERVLDYLADVDYPADKEALVSAADERRRRASDLLAISIVKLLANKMKVFSSSKATGSSIGVHSRIKFPLCASSIPAPCRTSMKITVRVTKSMQIELSASSSASRAR